MNQKPLISVVVPVYNVEKYLNKCLDSIIGQTYRNLEIILVDDGSTDDSGAICDVYREKDSRVRVVHQKNQGLSGARNTGINIANGELLGFVDSDDYIIENMYERLLEVLLKNDAQISICDCECIMEAGEEISHQEYPKLETEVLNKEQALQRLDGFSYPYWKYVTAWNKLYRKHIFEGLRYPVGKKNEDEFIAHILISKVERLAVISEPLYMYVQRADSIMGGSQKKKHIDSVYALKERCDFFLERNYKQLYKATLRMAYLIFKEILCEQKNMGEEFKEIYTWLFRSLLKTFDLRAIKLWILYH